METKHNPATALPWTPVSERANEGMGAPVETELRGADRQVAVRLGRLYNARQKQDAAYLAHAANAYPQLVAALRSAKMRLETIRDLMESQADAKLNGERKKYNYKRAALQMNEEAHAEIEDARAILRSLGELA